ncbi:MAG: type II secretion system protein [Oscillibacter sp.]|nr:type II secretion system protein [Oscillibacter sp.]
MKKLNKKGFTLAELLIVVAIIAILVAIGIPVFSTAMERSRETVDLANIRAAYAEFMSGQLSGNGIIGGVYKMDFKQTNGTGWLIDVSGLKNLLAPDSGTGTGATYALDTPKTAGATENAVNFWVDGGTDANSNGKPKMKFVAFSDSTSAGKVGGIDTSKTPAVALSDTTTDGKTYTVGADTTYYLYKKPAT